MSLRVWLPLNKDLRNNGTTNVTVTNNGATLSDDSYSFNGSSSRISLSQLNLSYPLSFSGWFKPTNVGTATQFWISYANDSSSNTSLAIGTYNNKLNIWRAGGDFSTNVTISSNVWYHVAVTISASKEISVYINGESVYNGTFTNTQPSSKWVVVGARSTSDSGGGQTSASYYYTGYIYDIRIYDHALSVKEVKELSKGLYLHYTFANPYVENTVNLVPKGMTLGWGDRWQITTTYPSGFIPQGTVYKQINSDAYLGLASNFISDYNTPTNYNGKYITMSCWYYRKSSSSPQLQFYVYGNNGTSQYSRVTTDVSTTDLTKVGEWTYAVIVQEFLSDLSGYSSLTYFKNQSSMNDDFYMADVQIEIKDHATPYTPNSRTTAVLPDNSGFGNDGTINGSLQVLSGSARYSECVYTPDGTSNYVYNALNNTRIKTVSFWTYIPSTIPGGAGIIFTHLPSKTAFGYYNSTKCIVFAGDSSHQGQQALYTISDVMDNKWHHIVTYNDGTTCSLFIDGIKRTGGITEFWTTTGNDLYIFRRYSGSTSLRSGKISDFRMYTTILSDSDVLDLYQTGCAIDKNQNLHCYEINEETNSGNKFKKNGIVNANILCEGAQNKTIYLKKYDSYTYDLSGELVQDNGSFYVYEGETTTFNGQKCYLWKRYEGYGQDGGPIPISDEHAPYMITNSLNLSLPFGMDSPEFVAMLDQHEDEFTYWFLLNDERYKSYSDTEQYLPTGLQGLCLLQNTLYEDDLNEAGITKLYETELTTNILYED